MSAWTDRILQEFPADLSLFWIACDPDDLLLDERILHSLRERGFEVLPFEDSVAFRTEYEERYRAAWDRGEEGSSKALVLQLRGTDLNSLPWDYVRMGRKVSLSLADLFSQAELWRNSADQLGAPRSPVPGAQPARYSAARRRHNQGLHPHPHLPHKPLPAKQARGLLARGFAAPFARKARTARSAREACCGNTEGHAPRRPAHRRAALVEELHGARRAGGVEPLLIAVRDPERSRIERRGVRGAPNGFGPV